MHNESKVLPMINVYFNKQCRNSDFSMADLHSHAYYEIYYLAKGERLLLFDDRLHTLSAPAIIVIPPWVMHKTEGGPYLRYNIYVSPQYLNGFEEKTLQSRKGCNASFCHIQLCTDSLFVRVFDFRNLFRRSSHNP